MTNVQSWSAGSKPDLKRLEDYSIEIMITCRTPTVWKATVREAAWPTSTSTDGCGEREESGKTICDGSKRLANRAGVERSQARTSGDEGYAAERRERCSINRKERKQDEGSDA